jgi:hypothetical protein
LAKVELKTELYAGRRRSFATEPPRCVTLEELVGAPLLLLEGWITALQCKLG